MQGYKKGVDLNDHLYIYGSDADAILALAKENPEYGEKISQKYDYTVAEVIWAVKKEMANSVEDVLARRVRLLFLDAREAIAVAPKVAEIMAKELGKSQQWIDNQIDSFVKLASNYFVDC
mgnify:FL=1